MCLLVAMFNIDWLSYFFQKLNGSSQTYPAWKTITESLAIHNMHVHVVDGNFERNVVRTCWQIVYETYFLPCITWTLHSSAEKPLNGCMSYMQTETKNRSPKLLRLTTGTRNPNIDDCRTCHASLSAFVPAPGSNCFGKHTRILQSALNVGKL
jgi:hypothetical protein